MTMHLVMKLSKLCNLRCTYCYEYEELHKKTRMPLADVEFFLRGLAEHYRNRPDAPSLHFICHGGEPLLLPAEYLREFCRLQDSILRPAGLKYWTSLQTNLTKFDDRTVELLRELDLGLGVSFDVFGGQRVSIKGTPVDERVLENLQKLIDTDLPFGAITVLHACNSDRVLQTYRFYNRLGIDYRILPIFAHTDPPARVAPLMLSHSQALESLKAVAAEWLNQPSRIKVLPISEYMTAATRYLAGARQITYEPANQHEWAMIIDTNGDAYNHGDAYLPQGHIGNIFKTPLTGIFASHAYRAMDSRRQARAATCRGCSFDGYCDQLPVIESIPSERAYDSTGHQTCPLARPMIQHCVDLIRNNPRTNGMLDVVASRAA